MATLQDIKKERKLTNAALAKRLGCSVSKVSTLMQGRHIRAINDQDIAQLAQALDITFERCWLAMQESYNQWDGLPLDTQHVRYTDAQYQVASEMGVEHHFDRPRNTSIDGVLVVEASRQIEQGREVMPEPFIDVKKLSKFLELAVAHYEKHAPGWFVAWLDETYMRLSDGWQSITLDEIMTIASLYSDGQWQYESYAVNNAYKLFERIGRSTVGIAGY